MKKIGIMTMHRVINYGSFMQAYGLKKIVENLGYKVEFVDYKEEAPIIKNSLEDTFKKIKNNINIIKFIKQRKMKNEFSKLYNENIIKYLNISQKRNYPYSKIDELIIGSDEVFNCLQPAPVGYSKELFGFNYENIPVISYAASFGSTNLETLQKYEIDMELTNMLKKFKAISVRDINSLNIVNELTNKKPNLNLDPVLIYDYSQECLKKGNLKDYIIIYAYNNRLTKKEEKYIKYFAKKIKKKIVSLGMYQQIADYNLVVNPFEVLPYFENADFIITDTFHGSIFSIKTHSNFATIIRKSNKNKLYDLLERLKKTDCIVNKIEDIEKLYKKKIDYKETDEIIDTNRKKAIEYLKNNLIQ